MPKNNHLFQLKWLEDDRLKDCFIKRNEAVAKCSYCCKDANVAKIDEAAFTLHITGNKHIKRSPSNQNIKSWMHQGM